MVLFPAGRSRCHVGGQLGRLRGRSEGSSESIVGVSSDDSSEDSSEYSSEFRYARRARRTARDPWSDCSSDGCAADRRAARVFMSKYLLRRPRSRRSLFSRARRRLRVDHTLGRVLRTKRTRPEGADRVSSPPPPPGSLFCKIPNFTLRNYVTTIGEHACPCGRGFTCSPIRRAWRNGSSACGSLPNLNRAQHDGSPKELC